MPAPKVRAGRGSAFRRGALVCAALALGNGMAPPASAQGLDLLGTTASTIEASSRGTTAATGGTAVTILIVFGISFVVGGVVYLVMRATAPNAPKAEPGESPPPAGAVEGAALIAQGFVAGGGALATLTASLVESPSAMDALTAEAAAGRGARLDALVRACGLPDHQVASAWLATAAAPAATQAEALAGVVRFIQRIGPELEPDPALAEHLVSSLAVEQARADFPANAPAHELVARWTGLSVAEVAPIVAHTLTQPDGQPVSRATRHADAVDLADRIGRDLGIAHPVVVSARMEQVMASAAEYGVVDERRGPAAQ